MPPEFRNEIRKARFRREIALDISDALAEEVYDFSLAISYTDSIPVTASRIRDYFALSLEEQFSWRDPYAALKRIIQLFENKGILVFQYAAIDVGISRGFSILETQFPVIALNGADTPRARIFTLFHEVTHLGLGSGAICDLRETDSKQDIEVFCNAVAAEALVPGEALLSQSEVKISRGNEEWPEPILVALSNRFSVSREVVLRRLLSLGLTTRDFYQAKREEYLEQYKEIKANRRGFMWYHKRVVRDNGPAFTNLVLDAYQQQRISAIEFSRFLGDINLKHYDSIVEEVRT
jgi:Zn-dependent peptidase ImmA (M78 family)